MLLLRIDSMDVSVRNVLNMGAVYGTSFALEDVTSVLKEHDDEVSEEEIAREVTKALDWAVNEGVLVLSTSSGEEGRRLPIAGNDIADTYSFRHEVWKSTLLSLMLESRKRDLHKKIAQGGNK